MRRSLPYLVQRLFRPSTRPVRRPTAHSLHVEQLEDRQLLDGSSFSPEALAQRYVGQLCEDLLGNSADPVGRASLATLLVQGQATPQQVAQAILDSPEGATGQVEDLYEGLLGR